MGENLAFAATDFASIKQCCLDKQISLVIVGPEDPLVKGIVDFFSQETALSHIAIVGPTQRGANLEGSKEFAKEFMQRHQIPTARYASFTKETITEGLHFLETMQAPYVLKADGLAAGKGVVILENLQEAQAELKKMLLEEKIWQRKPKGGHRRISKRDRAQLFCPDRWRFLLGTPYRQGLQAYRRRGYWSEHRGYGSCLSCAFCRCLLHEEDRGSHHKTDC